MNLEQLHQQLDRVARRMSRRRFLQRTACAFLPAAVAAAGLWSVWTWTATDWLSRHSASLLAATMLGVPLLVLLLRRSRVDRQAAARAVEREFPDLNQRLLAALEQHPAIETGRLSYLQNQVVAEALDHAHHNDWSKAMPVSKLAAAAALQLAGLGLFAAAFCAIWLRPPVVAGIHRSTQTLHKPIIEDRLELDVAVEPGDVEIERGTDLLVLARFPSELPADVVLRAVDAAGKRTRVPLSKSLDDPVFGGRLTGIDSDLTYQIEYDGRSSREFHVTTFDYPALERLDAVVRFPDYTGLPETKLEETRRVSMVEGSQITLIGRANKPIAAARLIDESDSAIDFDIPMSEGDRFELTLRPTKSERYTLLLIDEKDRRNKFPQEVVIEVTPNRRPDIKLTFPAKDLRVSPIEEISLEATAWDDFGVRQYGLVYALAGKQPTTVVLGDSVAGREERAVAHLLSCEELQADPDQLISYYFFADDHGPDGKLRRTFGDMYFAEVRHFEEIFRQGQQPPGGGKQQGGGSPQSKKLEELAKLQKQIVMATWKLIRSESGWPGLESLRSPGPDTSGASLRSSPGHPAGHRADDSVTNDVQLIAESQQAALDQLHELSEKLKNPKSQGMVGAVVTEMASALDALQKAAGDRDASHLPAALSSEQAAYQGLLKLRAREHKVSQSQGGGGGGGGGSSRSQQQMNQLELSNKENRYQTERRAAGKTPPANREQLQVLNRLRELARRQQGLNDKLKELENALRAAKNEREQEEIRRRLKRLRDEQQEMLRDVDKLRNRMERPENQRSMADDRRRLDQTREKIRQTSDALKQGQLSQALNSGTRSARDLDKMKEDFRQRSAGQFADAMKELRSRARSLSEKQRELTEQMKSQSDARRTLRDSGRQKQIAQRIDRQKQNLSELLDQAKEVVRQAEQSEPLLSRKLYETIRKSRSDQTGKHLGAASELAEKGLSREAAEAQHRATRGIERVQKGIERAAESVLGNESETLRTAKKELDDVAKSLKNELAQANRRSGKPKQTAEIAKNSSSNSSSDKAGARSPQSAIRHPQSNASPGKSPSQSSPSSQSSPDESSQPGQSAGDKSAGGQSSGKQKPGLRGGKQNSSSKSGPSPPSSFLNQGGMAGGPGSPGGEMKPLTGGDFRRWSDKLRDVEEMVEDPRLRGDVARIRDRARSMRVEFKRHSKEPNWDLVRGTILAPLVELQQQLAEEIARRERPDALVPIDRDPVPERFTELVEKYYEQLGRGKRGRSERGRGGERERGKGE